MSMEAAQKLIDMYEHELGRISRRSRSDTYCTARDLGHMAGSALRLGKRMKENA